MAETDTPEENGRKILEIYRYFNSKVGHVLASNNFLAVGMNRRWDSQDLRSGIEFSESSGWIERTPNGWFRLTESGFKAM